MYYILSADDTLVLYGFKKGVKVSSMLYLNIKGVLVKKRIRPKAVYSTTSLHQLLESPLWSQHQVFSSAHSIHLSRSFVKGKYETAYFNDLIDKREETFSHLVYHFLSFMGKLMVIKHVLQSLPIHLNASSGLPKGGIHCLEKLFASFFWNNSNNSRHLFGFLFDTYSCFWKIFLPSHRSLWATFIKKKYIKSPLMTLYFGRSSPLILNMSFLTLVVMSNL